jgi:hypothetical protein
MLGAGQVPKAETGWTPRRSDQLVAQYVADCKDLPPVLTPKTRKPKAKQPHPSVAGFLKMVPHNGETEVKAVLVQAYQRYQSSTETVTESR